MWVESFGVVLTTR